MAKKLSKKYAAALAHIEQGKLYSLEEAVEVLLKTSVTSFDSSVEVHVYLDIDTTKADQMVRSTIVLPHGTGKTKRIAAFVEGDMVQTALQAGADIAGVDVLIPEIEKGNIHFDVAIAHPNVMKSLGKIAKILGTKGLMPNPKAGTVTTDIEQAIKEVKKGRVEFRADKQSTVHSMVGKVSFGKEKLLENISSLLDAIESVKPAVVKGTYMKTISLATTMGPGVSVNPSSL